MATDRTGAIRPGMTGLSTPMVFTVADAIDASQTVNITITNGQKYLQFQTFTVTLDNITGTADVVCTGYGKVNLADDYVAIGSPVTLSADGTATITAATPCNYNYLKLALVAGGGAQHSHITAFTVKTANAFDIPANSGTLTISRATEGAVTITTKDNNAVATSTVYRAGSTGPVVFGSTDGTASIASSDWTVGVTGIATNMGTYNGLTILNSIGRLVTTATAAADSTVAGSKLAAVDQFVTVASGGATRVITLPAAGSTTIGLVIEGYVAATGFDLRVATSQYSTAKLNNVTSTTVVGVEAAIPATTKFKVVCISATEWILTATDELGAVITAIVPAAIEKR